MEQRESALHSVQTSRTHSRMRRRFALTLPALVIGTVIGCGGGAGSAAAPDVEPAGECTTASDCTAGSSCTDGACVAPPAAPTITSFEVDKVKVTTGKSATLTAVFSGGTGTIDQGVGSVTSGVAVATGNITAATKYTLTVTNAAGETATRTVDVATIPAPAITSFQAAAGLVSKYTSTTLTAVFAGGAASIDGGVGAVTSGVEAATTALSAPKTYTLTVTNELGDSVTATASVDVKKELFVSSYTDASIAVFDVDAAGDVTPKRRIAGANTTLDETRGLFVVGDELVSVNQIGAIATFNVTDDGDLAPKRRIAGSATTLTAASGIYVSGGEIFLGDQTSQMKVFNLLDTGDVAPKRVIAGESTGLSATHYTWVDGGEVYVSNFSGDTVTVHPVSASGDVAPTRTIAIPGGEPLGLYINGNDLIVAQGSNAIRTFDKTTGALLRTIAGESTQLGFPDQCALHGGELYCADYDSSALLVFPVAADGNVAPTRVVSGANTKLAGALGVFIY